MISWDTYSKIRKCNAEGLSMRHCARVLGISRKTVKSYWDGGRTPDDRKNHPPSVDSPEKLEIMEALTQYFEDNKYAPKKQAPNAKTAWVALRDKFNVGESTIRGYVRELKEKHPDAFIPLSFDPGEVTQVDWREIKAVIDGHMRRVPVFCAALPYSYAIFVAVLPDMTMPSFIEGHMMAFEWFSGVTERVFYDNLKTAVLMGTGKNAVKQGRFKALEAHYSFEAVFMNADSGHEKGSVENLCGLCRSLAFTPAPNVESLKALQDHAISQCASYIEFHKIKGRQRPIREMYREEREALLPLPAKRIEPGTPVQALVHDDLTFRHDTTKYSLPIEFVGKTITARAHAYTIEAWRSGSLIYTHDRPFVKGRHQYIPEHYLPLLEKRPRAMRNAAPLKYGALPKELEEFRGRCIGKDKLEQLAMVLMLGKDVEAGLLLEAVDYANKTGRPTYAAVCFYLNLQKESRNTDRPIFDGPQVVHADLAQYDALLRGKEAEND